MTTIILFIFLHSISSPNVAVELTPLPPFNVKHGESFSLEIAARGDSKFNAQAVHIQGTLTLPEGFVEDSTYTRTRQLLFGNLDPNEAIYYVLTITALDSVKAGQYNATLKIWGANVPMNEMSLAIMVDP